MTLLPAPPAHLKHSQTHGTRRTRPSGSSGSDRTWAVWSSVVPSFVVPAPPPARRRPESAQ
eukprot:1619187-Rhodomonas_salina.1